MDGCLMDGCLDGRMDVWMSGLFLKMFCDWSTLVQLDSVKCSFTAESAEWNVAALRGCFTFDPSSRHYDAWTHGDASRVRLMIPSETSQWGQHPHPACVHGNPLPLLSPILWLCCQGNGADLQCKAPFSVFLLADRSTSQSRRHQRRSKMFLLICFLAASGVHSASHSRLSFHFLKHFFMFHLVLPHKHPINSPSCAMGGVLLHHLCSLMSAGLMKKL